MNTLALVLLAVWFLLIFVVRSVQQKRATGDTGIRPGALADDASGVEKLAYLLLVVAFIGALAAPIAAMVGLEALTDSDLIPLAGLAVVVIGICSTYLAQLGMGDDWRIGIDRTEATGLVTSGPFSLARNPVFSAMILTGAGFAAMVPNAIAIAAAICLLVAIELQVRYVEEPHLQRLHGEPYGRYAAQVGRFVPLIGRLRSS